MIYEAALLRVGIEAGAVGYLCFGPMIEHWVEDGRKASDLEKENARLRRAISDLTLDKLILQ